MKKIVLNVNGEPTNECMLVYNKKLEVWECWTREQVYSEVYELKKEIAKLINDIEVFKNGVNGKLKDYHNILQMITKEE